MCWLFYFSSTFRDSTFSTIMINILIISLIIIGYSRAEPSQYNCCNNRTNQLINRTCDNNGSEKVEIKIKCLDKYVLDSRIEDDNFNVAKNGSLFLKELDLYVNSDKWVMILLFYFVLLILKRLHFGISYWQCWIFYFDSFCLVNIHDNEAEEYYPAALVCFTDPDIEIDIFFMMKAVLLFISVVFLILTLYVYYLLSELRETQVTWNSYKL